MNKRTLFAGMLFAAVLFSGCGDGVADSSDMSEASRGEISGVVSAEKDISGNEEVSREPEQSGEGDVSDADMSEASADDGDSEQEGVFEIDGCYYLKPEGATEAVTGDDEMLMFHDFESMAAFMQKKEYTKAEREAMTQLFAKDKYGIRLGDINNALCPRTEGYDIEYCYWTGDGHFCYQLVKGDAAYSEMQIWTKENSPDDFIEYMDKRCKYEYLIQNTLTSNHRQSTMTVGGVEFDVVKFETATHYCANGYGEFARNGVSYRVYIDYNYFRKTEVEVPEFKIRLVTVIASDGKSVWRCELLGEAAIAEPDYIASFGWKEIDLTK